VSRFGKSKYPDVPSTLKTAGDIAEIKAGIGRDSYEDQTREGLFDPINMPDEEQKVLKTGSSRVFRMLAKYITNKKYESDVSVQVLIEQRCMKDKIFESIFEKFSKGSKLAKYDEFKTMEQVKDRIFKE